MNNIAPDTRSDTYQSGTTARIRDQQTLLFPSLVKNVDPDRRLSVLEIGPASPETLAYFSHYKCRVHFAAMYTDPILQMQDDDHTEGELTAHFKRSFGFRKGTRFDLCLFWDFLNYLNDRALRALNTALKPHLYEGTRGHAFTLRTLDTSFVNQQYGIRQDHLFSIRPRSGAQPRTFPHTQAILVNLLTEFDIDQGMLLPDGRLEVLLSASR